jgi:hypothetical protein
VTEPFSFRAFLPKGFIAIASVRMRCWADSAANENCVCLMY